MNRKQQLQQKGTGISTVPVQQAENAPVSDTPRAAGVVFNVVPMTKVPEKHTPGAAMAKYKELEDALKKLPKDQALCIPVPADKQPQKYASNILNAVRKKLPGTRSRTTKTELFLWVGEPGPSRVQRSVKGAA
jgi:hypothetical protein